MTFANAFNQGMAVEFDRLLGLLGPTDLRVVHYTLTRVLELEAAGNSGGADDILDEILEIVRERE